MCTDFALYWLTLNIKFSVFEKHPAELHLIVQAKLDTYLARSFHNL